MPLKTCAETERVPTLISMSEPCLLSAPLAFQIPKPVKISIERQLFCYFNPKLIQSPDNSIILCHFLMRETQPGSNMVPCLSVCLFLVPNKDQILLVCLLLKP